MNTSDPELSNVSDPPKPESPPAQPQRSRVGHIARLPKRLRNIVNRMLDDGKSYEDILQLLEKHRAKWPRDITALTYKHLVRWRAGGYQDWLFHQEQLAELRAKEEFSLDFLTKTNPSKLHLAAVRLALLRIIQALHQVNLSHSDNLASRHPSSYAALLASINRLSRSTLAFTQFNRVLEEEARERGPRKREGLSDEARAKIESLLGFDEYREEERQRKAAKDATHADASQS